MKEEGRNGKEKIGTRLNPRQQEKRGNREELTGTRSRTVVATSEVPSFDWVEECLRRSYEV